MQTASTYKGRGKRGWVGGGGGCRGVPGCLGMGGELCVSVLGGVWVGGFSVGWHVGGGVSEGGCLHVGGCVEVMGSVGGRGEGVSGSGWVGGWVGQWWAVYVCVCGSW